MHCRLSGTKVRWPISTARRNASSMRQWRNSQAWWPARKATLAARFHLAKKIEAVYAVPYLSHAMMGPLNCAVDLRADHCEIWTGTQLQTIDRMNAAAIAGLKPEQVQIHTTLLGG